MNFSRYSPPNTLLRGISFEELLEISKDGSILARAEDSGSEGCYVEVARWKQGSDCHSGDWCRYAFEKVFGGEDLKLEHQTAGPEVSAHATAERIAARINAASGNAHIALIHHMPVWEETP